MKIRYLGTAASEGWPALFCRCSACLAAERLGGKNIRSRCQTLVNEDLLLDFGPDTYYHRIRFGLNLSRVKYLLITHFHSDHLYSEDIAMHGGDYACNMENETLQIFCSREIREIFQRATAMDCSPAVAESLQWNILKPFETVRAGDYEITALPARHSGHEDFTYLIRQRGKTIWYCHDSGFPGEEIFDYLRDRGLHLDLVSMDCTFGQRAAGMENGHMGAPENAELVKRLREIGACDEQTALVVNHFSHNCGLLHEELEQVMEGYGFRTAFDGMEVTI